MFNWLILAAAVAFSLFVSLLARKLFEHHQHYRSVERIQRQIQMQQFFIHEQMMREEERLHRQMVEQGVMSPNNFRVMAHGMNPIIQQRNTETEMTEASSPHDFYYKTNFDLSRDGRVYRSIPSNDIRLCSVCGCVIAHSAIQLHYNFAHPDWKPGVTMMAQQVREERVEKQNRERAARMLEERRRWEEHQRIELAQRESEQQERSQQQQARDIRVAVETEHQRLNQVEEALRTSREFRNAVETQADRLRAMEDFERNAQNGVFIEDITGRRVRFDPPQTLRDQIMSTRCVQCERNLPTLHDAWTAFDGTTPLCHECYRMREISGNRQPVENRGATATLSTFDEARRLLVEPDPEEAVRQSILAQLRVTEPGT